MNIRKLNIKSLYSDNIPHLFIYSDASYEGLATIYEDNGKVSIPTKNVSFKEETKSSTWRKLEAIRYSIVAM